jgi:hypothetical protein
LLFVLLYLFLFLFCWFILDGGLCYIMCDLVYCVNWNIIRLTCRSVIMTFLLDWIPLLCTVFVCSIRRSQRHATQNYQIAQTFECLLLSNGSDVENKQRFLSVQTYRVTFNAPTIITYVCASVVTHTLSKPRSNFIQGYPISDICSSVLQQASNGTPSVCVEIHREFLLRMCVGKYSRTALFRKLVPRMANYPPSGKHFLTLTVLYFFMVLPFFPICQIYIRNYVSIFYLYVNKYVALNGFVGNVPTSNYQYSLFSKKNQFSRFTAYPEGSLSHLLLIIAVWVLKESIHHL